MRSNYWSCSKFADWVRGTDYPDFAEHHEWENLKLQAKAKHPFRWWLAEEAIDKVQDFVMFPSDTFYNIKYYIENRWISRTHGLTAHPSQIKPGEWCDLSHRFLPCMFNELVDFVEVELAWSYVRWSDEEVWKKYNVPKFHLRSWRSKEAGLAYLDWASNLTYGTSCGVDESSSNYGKLTSQAEHAIEILALYKWWTEEYPKRQDPSDESGLSDLFDEHEVKYGSMFAKRSEEDDAKVKALLNVNHDIEKQQEDEDTEMMIRLIKVRQGLWT